MAGTNTVERIIDVVELMIDHPQGIMLSDIARQLGLAKSATHRLLTSLVDRHYVEQMPGLTTYRLSLKLSGLGFHYVAQTGVFDICQPVLERLAKETGELVRIALADERGLMWGSRAQGARFGLRYEPGTGSTVVLHATATGRAWLAALSDEEALALVEASGFEVPERFGPQKVRNREQLLTELGRSRQLGYALSSEETEPGMRAVATAIPGRNRSPGSLSVAGPIVRLSDEAIERIVPQIKAAAAEIGLLWPLVEWRTRSEG